MPDSDPLLQERDVGPWEGLTHSEIEATWPGYLESGRRPEGWEGDAEVVLRANRAGRKLVRSTRSTPILVVTHAGLIRALERHQALPRASLPNLAGRWAMANEEGFRLTTETFGGTAKEP